MTHKEKEKIIELRKKRYTYGQISIELNIPRSSISTFCKRNKIDAGSEDKYVSCKNCEKIIKLERKRKPKKFCSDECRVSWWNKHQDLVNKKAFYDITCSSCGKQFKAYGNKKQKYCSHVCYINIRYKKGGEKND